MSTRERDPNRRGHRWVARVAVAAAVAVACLVVAVLLAPVRGLLLNVALERLQRRLPGDLVVEHPRWPHLGTIAAERLMWTDGADTIAAARDVEVTVALRPLLRRDLDVTRLRAHGVRTDVPALAHRLAPPGTAPAPADTASSASGFPRPGSIPGVPSVALRDVDVTAGRILLGTGDAVRDVVLDGGIVLLRDQPPQLLVRRLTARGAAHRWGVTSLSVDVDPDRGVARGEATGDIAGKGPFRVALSSLGGARVRVVVSDSAGTGPPQSPGVRADLTIEHRAYDVRAVEVDALVRSPGTRALAADSLVAGPLAGVDLAGLAARVTGRVSLAPAPSLRARIALQPNGWIDGGEADVAYASGAWSVRAAGVRVADLSVEAGALVTPDSVDVRSRVHAGGTRWLDRLGLAGVAPLDSLHATLRAEAAGPRPPAVVHATLDARAVVGGVRVDAARVDGDVPLAGGRGSLRASARIAGYAVAFAAAIEGGDGTTVALSPVVVAAGRGARPPAAVPARGAGRVRVGPASGALSVENVRVTGALGDFTADGRRGADGAGRFRLAARWPRAPEALIRAAGLSPAAGDSLRVRWLSDGPFAATVDGEITPAQRMTASADFDLPGPHTLATLLPDSARVDGLGPLRGSARVVVRARGRTAADASVDLARTSWIDSSAVRVHARGDSLWVDTLAVAIPGVGVRAVARRAGGVWNARATLAIDDVSWLRRLAPGLPDVTGEFSATARGTPAAPEVRARLTGKLAAGGYRVPRFAGRLAWDGGGLSARFDMPRGAVTPLALLDRVSVRYRGTEPAPALVPVHAPARIVVDARGRDVALYESATVRADTQLVVSVDTLRAEVGRQGLAAVHHFAVRVDRTARRVAIDSLALRGTLGSLEVNGTVAPGGSDLAADIQLDLPAKPASVALPDRLWPDRVDIHARARGRSDLEAHAKVTGFRLAGGRRPALSLDATARADTVRAQLTVEDSAATLLDATADVPARVSLFPPSLRVMSGAVRGRAHADGLPIAVSVRPGRGRPGARRVASVRGDVTLGGTTTAPAGSLAVSVRFPDWPKMARYGAQLRASLDSTRAAKGSLVLERDGAPLLTGRARLPVRVSLAEPAFGVPKDSRVACHVESDRIHLNEIDPLLPADIGLGGTARVNLDVTGPVGDPDLDGSLVMEAVEVSVAQRARVTSGGRLTLAGTASKPVVRGGVTIDSGLFRIPEEQKELLPAEGDAMLVPSPAETTRVDTTASAPDTAFVSAPDTALAGTAPPPAGHMENVDADVTVQIPRGFFVRGHGLDTEFSGMLRIVQKNGTPALTGELHAMRGSLLFLGRTFTLDQGSVTFYGEQEVDPSIDIELSTTIETTAIHVTITGTVRKPDLKLTSDPAMEEGDIMSYLVFGRPLNRLDSNQVGLVEQRTTEIAAALGTARLQATLAKDLGIDVVSIRNTSPAQQQSTTLVLGKYLSPKLLLKYERLLEEQASYWINLEYFLTRRLKIDTLYGRQDQSGIEVDWSVDY